MRRGLVALTALMLASPPEAAKAEKLLLALCVNGACSGTAFVVAEKDHVLIDADSAEAAGIAIARLPHRTMHRQSLVDLSAIGNGAKIMVDAAHGRLDLTLPGSAFDGTTVQVQASRERRNAGADPSVFLNYALNLGSSRGSASVFFDGGIADGHWLLRDDPSWSQAQGFLRGMTRLEYDDTASDLRWTAGDQFAYSNDGLGGTALVGGIGVARAFDLDPYLITFPQPAISGVLQAPGTIDIYENGVLVSQRQVPAGPFNLASLGLGAGQNDVRVVVQDPFGGTSVLQQNFYAANAMLAPGLADFGYQLGFERVSPQANGYDVQRPVLLARQSLGITDILTAGLRVEAETGVANAGPSLALRLPVGAITAGFAGSAARAGGGTGFSASYQYSARVFNAGAGIQGFSGDYRRIGDADLPASFRPRRIAYVNAGLTPVRALNLSISAADSAYADGSRQRTATATLQYNFRNGMAATCSFDEDFNRPGRNTFQLGVNLTIPLGRTSISLTAAHDAVYGEGYGFGVQRSVPSDSGFGFNGNATFGGQGGVSGAGQLAYQSQYGFLQLSGQHFGGTTSGNLLVSGSVVAVDGSVFLARPIRQGFALVQVPDAPGVTITRENQPVGRTDGNGNLLVTDLLPYQANRLGLDQASVPMQYMIDSTEKIVGVPRLGGTIVRFGVHRLHAARGKLHDRGKPVQYGTATVMTQAGPRKTLIGLDGSIFFADLPAGQYRLAAHSAEGDLTCRLTMPPGGKAITNLGPIACAAR